MDTQTTAMAMDDLDHPLDDIAAEDQPKTLCPTCGINEPHENLTECETCYFMGPEYVKGSDAYQQAMDERAYSRMRGDIEAW